MKHILICICLLYLCSGLYAHKNLLHITGAYHYSESSVPGIDVIAVVVQGDLNLIGDPDDLTLVNADNDSATGYSVDDCSFLSPDGEDAWINLPEGFNEKMVKEVFVVCIRKDIKKIKIKFDGTDISDACKIQGSYPLLPPLNKRVKHDN